MTSTLITKSMTKSMTKVDYNSPTALKNFMNENGFAMQKKFGQNFLVNSALREKLIDALDVSCKTSVWEIGPGIGAMTDILLDRGANVTAFEIDKGFISCLKQFFEKNVQTSQATENSHSSETDGASQNGCLKIVEGDVMRTWHDELLKSGIPSRFFGNLPYNIASILIADTIERGIRFDKCIFTIQKEVAERMSAKPSTPFYSSFSVLCQWAYQVKTLFDLAPGNFWPRPEVTSRAVIMTPREDFPRCKNPSHFMKMQRALFSMRRKNLRNTLSAFLGDSESAEKTLSDVGVDLRTRAEELSIEKLLELSDALQ